MLGKKRSGRINPWNYGPTGTLKSHPFIHAKWFGVQLLVLMSENQPRPDHSSEYTSTSCVSSLHVHKRWAFLVAVPSLPCATNSIGLIVVFGDVMTEAVKCE